MLRKHVLIVVLVLESKALYFTRKGIVYTTVAQQVRQISALKYITCTFFRMYSRNVLTKQHFLCEKCKSLMVKTFMNAIVLGAPKKRGVI